MRVDEIQERLIKNKTLLNVIEPSLENPSLEVLLGILQRRIELDKECLFQFNQLKKDRRLLMTSSRNPSVAPAIMRFQKGCQQVGRKQNIHSVDSGENGYKNKFTSVEKMYDFLPMA